MNPILTFGSVCSGIEAASVAWHPLGFKAEWFSEIEPFPSAVLAHHYPDVPNLGDMCQLPRRILRREIDAPDILVGGTPCQAFSVAGLGESLNDERGLLSLKYVEILNAIDFIRQREGRDPAISVWENVPGILFTKDNAFGCFIGALAGEDCALRPAGKRWTNAGCVYGPRRTVAWRILDAQYFEVPQRRRRIFVVASSGAISPEQILFEQGGLCGNPASSANTRPQITGTFTSSAYRGCPGNQPEAAAAGLFQPVINGKTEVVGVYGEGSFADYREGRISTVKASGGACGYGSENLIVSINGNIIGRTPQNGDNGSGFNHDIAPTLTRTDRHAVAFQSNNSASMNMPVCDGMAPTLTCNAKYMSVQYSTQVRRFTPVECERLQGFPDNYTQVVVKGKEAKDTPRYVAIGNSMPVPVMHWLGKRIRGAYLMQRFQLLGESQPTPSPNI